jgi:hypothetical protein
MRANVRSIQICVIAAAFGAVLPAHAALVVSSDPTANVNCTQGQFGRVCTATANNAVLNIGKLTNLLASQNVNVQTGSATNDIVINAALSWTSASGLALIAQRSIVVNAHVSDAGSGELSLTTGVNGHLFFGPQGNIGFLSTGNLLVINNQGYQLVNSVSDLATWVGNNAAGFYALSASYDAAPDGTYAQAPLQATFSGIFDGLGNTISNLGINDTTPGDNVGLFAIVQSGTVENVRLAHVNIGATGSSSSSSLAGGLVGRNEGTMFGDTVTGSVTAKHAFAGGLAGGQDFGTTSESAAAVTVKVTGSGEAGGLLGYNNNVSSVSNSHATGNVTGSAANMEVGGLIGGNGESVDNSYATGSVSAGNNGYAGGLVGFLYGGTISKSYATGSVSTGASANGLRATAGGLTGQVDNCCTITQSWATGAVTSGAGAYGGGLAGDNFGSIERSYAMGSVTSGGPAGGLAGANANGGTVSAVYSTGQPQGAGGVTGGLLGFDSAQGGSLQHTYWDTTSSGIADPSQGAGSPPNDPGITALTTKQLRAGLPVGFKPGIWGRKPTINNGLPYLLAVPPG